ncbi:hypothetical protein AB6A40_009028 [Gnathostoma spinigerum]|uniref:Uncharacterized protein n=1 Tax=Gnathostoma spinigerum TaxID=75299 RepID=A0ABD6EQR9_9BILA
MEVTVAFCTDNWQETLAATADVTENVCAHYTCDLTNTEEESLDLSYYCSFLKTWVMFEHRSLLQLVSKRTSNVVTKTGLLAFSATLHSAL